MNRIDATFAKLRGDGQKGLITFIMAGDGGLEATKAYVHGLIKGGADIVELGVPFSDPIADGPVNQAAAYRALEVGITLEGIFETVRALRQEVETPILLMGYMNPFYSYGLEAACKDAVAAGVDGFIIADLPPLEAELITAHAQPAGLATVFLAAPNSSQRRLEAIAKHSTGFVYCLARAGVTGESEALSEDSRELVSKLRRLTDKPLAVGFGIKSAQQVRRALEYADAAIVGSALVRIIAEAGSPAEAENSLVQFVKKLRTGAETG